MMIYPQINFCQSVQKQHQERQKKKDKKGKNASKVTAFLQAFSSWVSFDDLLADDII